MPDEGRLRGLLALFTAKAADAGYRVEVDTSNPRFITLRVIPHADTKNPS